MSKSIGFKGDGQPLLLSILEKEWMGLTRVLTIEAGKGN